MTPILEVRDLQHVYSAGTPFQRTAIDRISFSLQRGESLGLIGHTGSGKSTLIQHLNGLLKPSAGQVLFDGKDIWSDKAFTRQIRFRVGLVFQYPEYQLFEETVRRDIGFGPRNMGLPEEEVERRVLEAARFVELSPAILEQSPFELSGGQKRRVAIAGVIAMEPDVLVLDEPTAGLDPAGRQSILENIAAYRAAKNAAIVMVSHNMEEAAGMADRLLVLNRGSVALDGAPKEVFSHAAEIQEMGLDLPEVTKIFLRLRELGLDVDPAVYTVEQACGMLLHLRGGCAHA